MIESKYGKIPVRFYMKFEPESFRGETNYSGRHKLERNRPESMANVPPILYVDDWMEKI